MLIPAMVMNWAAQIIYRFFFQISMSVQK